MQMDLVSFTVTAPGAGPTAMTVVTGDSATIRNSTGSGLVCAVAAWTNSQAVGFTRWLWPSGHDMVANITYRNLALQPDNKIPRLAPWMFQPQDPLTVSQSGSAVAGDVETAHMLMFYEDLPGTDGRLINAGELKRRGYRPVTVTDSSTATAAGAYSGQRTLNQVVDQFKPNTDYALLGAVLGANCGALCVRGVDMGNLRVGIPGLSQDANVAGEWFVALSEHHDLPLIPVFNSANRAGIFIDQVTNELLTAVPFTLNLVELAPRS